MELNKACREGNLTKVIELIESGADVNSFVIRQWIWNDQIDQIDTSSFIHIETEQREYLPNLLFEREFNKDIDKDDDKDDYKEYCFDKYFMCPLIQAVENGHFEICKFLIKNGSQTDFTFDYPSPLFIAAEKGYKEICELLIANGADINADIFCGNTPLMIAAFYGHLQICELLIANGANVNFVYHHYDDDYDDECSLTCAIKSKNIEICKLLIANGASVNLTILNYVCRNPNLVDIEILKLLIEEVEKKIMDDYDYFKSYLINALMRMLKRVLVISIKENNFEICKFIVENYKELINKQELKCKYSGLKGYWEPHKALMYNALMYCAKYNNKEICALLIENGANLDIQTETGKTALMIASKKGNLEICKMLLDAGANVDFHYDPTLEKSYKKFGKLCSTPLTYAVANEKYDVCKLLLNYGANVNINNTKFDKRGNQMIVGTPICFTKNKEIILLLLDYGAEIEISKYSISEESYKIIYDIIKEKNQKRCKLIKEELMKYVWNPEREYTKWALLDELATPCGGAGF